MIKRLLNIFLYIYSFYAYFCLLLALCDVLNLTPIGTGDGIVMFILLPVTFLVFVLLSLDLIILIPIFLFKAYKRELCFPKIEDFVYKLKKHPYVTSLEILNYIILIGFTIYIVRVFS